MNQREEDFWRAKHHILFGWWMGRKLKKLGLNLCAYSGFTDFEDNVFQKVMVRLPDDDPVQEFIRMKYLFDSALVNIENILCDDKLQYDYAKILEDLHEHEKKIGKLFENRIIRNNQAANEYYLKLQELGRVAAGRVEDLMAIL
jgi:hypothetical protein